MYHFLRHALSMLDELFLFLMYLPLGSSEMDLADRFGIHHSTVSRIVVTGVNYLYILLGSLYGCLWKMSRLCCRRSSLGIRTPIIDRTELRCQ
ncbi:unnamed protein product [Oncorhynchus mykiss]|uniref:Transposase Helix-turn-helix domain-containing protein n=1 Tax=Oncorhynchus mykiss TaxID=8022 RepID=A0A060XEP5_ONCMY|nr:unnamed protein product [Oncorhynchus mykiss]